MAINEKFLDELLGDRDPNEVFSKDGLLDDLKKALADRVYHADWCREALKDKGITPCIGSRKNPTVPIPNDEARKWMAAWA